MSFPSVFFVNTVGVETYTANSAFGSTYAASTTAACLVEDVTRLVISATGEQVSSGTTLYTPIEDAALYGVGSRVTLWAGTTSERIAYVLGNTRYDARPVIPFAVCQVSLQ